MTIRTIITSSMNVSFAFLMLRFVIWWLMCTCRLQICDAKFCHLVAHVHLQTSNLAPFTVNIATTLSLMSKKIEMKAYVVT